jgi:pseudouridylate synthase
MMRLNKFLSSIGFCSRRQADKYIENGKIYIDDSVAGLGTELYDKQKVYFEKTYIGQIDDLKLKQRIVLAVNKPRGIVCTSSDKDRAENIVDFINYPLRIYPVGRLDKDSEGLLLMTNDGSLVNALMKAKNHHEKEYMVEVNKDIDEAFLQSMSAGVYIKELKVKTRKCYIEKISEKSFKIILTQGLNRQIRRMCESLGFKVLRLRRIRIVNITLGKLKTGEYRKLSTTELDTLDSLIGE